MINELLSAIAQLLIMTLIPFIVWLLKKERDKSFFEWIGLKKVKVTDRKIFVYAVLVIVIFSLVGFYIDGLLGDDNFQQANTRFAGLGMSGIVPALIFSFIKTGLAEEIFFRGFLLKVLSQKFGFWAGNSIQAIFFGMLHGGPMVITVFGWGIALAIFTFTATTAWMLGYINEKCGNGSIIPSWMLHGAVNTISTFRILF